MTDRFHAKTTRLAAWLARLASLVAFLFALGYLLHTSYRPVVFEKYDLPYATFLGFLFFIALPAFHFLARFCAATHELTFSSGRTLVVRPWQKLAVIFVAALVVSLTTMLVTAGMVSNRVVTYNLDIYHPYLQNTHLPNDPLEHVNRWGFRGDNLDVAKRDDAFRVFVMGGSTVYCGTVPYEQTHCKLLEKRLQEAYPRYRIQVQNLGADWHTTEHDTIKLLFLAQDFSPDLLIAFHGINDMVRSLSPEPFGEGDYWPDYRHYYGATAHLTLRNQKAPASMAFSYWCSDLRFDQLHVRGPFGHGLGGVQTFFVPKTRPVEIAEWQSLPAFERNLRDFVAIARSKGMQVLLATQPSLYRDDLTPAEQQLLMFSLTHYRDGKRPSLHSLVEGMRIFNDATRGLGKESAVDVVDLEQRMPKTTDYLYDDVHYTPAGNELIGNAFADHIIESGIVDRVMQERYSAAESVGDVGQAAAASDERR